MAFTQGVIGGLAAGQRFAEGASRSEARRQMQISEQQQARKQEVETAIDDVAKTAKELNEQFSIQRAAAPSAEDQAKIDQQYGQIFDSIQSQVSRVATEAAESGVPVDPQIELSKLMAVGRLRDLRAEQVVSATGKGAETAAVSQAQVPAKQELQESATTQSIRLEQEKSRLRQQELGVKARLSPQEKQATSEFARTLGKEQAKTFTGRHEGAIEASRALQGVQNAKRLLDEGVVTGAGADFLVSFGKGLERLGFNLGDELDNSQAFLAAQASQVANIIKQFGAGTGLSDADREFATKAAAGDIAMSEDAIREIIRINESAYRNVVKDFNKSVDEIEQSRGSTGVPFELRVDLPPRDVRDITNDIRTAKTVEELRRLEEELRNVSQP
jgi:hypothetical protein